MRLLVRLFNILVVLTLLVLATLGYWYAWRPLPQTSGTLALPLRQPAQIIRDELGVAHIEARTIEDLFFLQGYVTAQDRLWQMDALRRVAAGELSEIIGPAALEPDQEARRLRMKRLAEMHARNLHGSDRNLLVAYARGVNHFIETHRNKLPLEFTLLAYDPQPWRIADSILIGLQMYRTLSSSWREEVLKRAMLAQGDARKVEMLFPARTGAELQPGSNAWAISGRHTASGKPLLANDTHLEWSFPSTWYSIHLKGPDLNVIGFSLPGLPCVIIGHNESIAWGVTNLHFDVQDLYREQFSQPPAGYVFQGQTEQARLERETIRVKGAQAREVSFLVTRHGPILVTAGNESLALRWTAAEPGGWQFPFLELNRATNWEQFRSALKRFVGPAQNFVYADVEGNIGYQAAGKLPVRKNYRGDFPVQGGGNYEWEGFIPFEELPSSLNPPSGYIITANQNPFPENYPYAVNGNFASYYRSRQIEARLKSRGGWTAQDQLSIQMDVYSAFSHFLAQQVSAAYEKRGRGNPAWAPAVQALRSWDGQMRAGSAAPLIVTLLYQHLRRAVAEKAAPGHGANYDLQIAPAVTEQILRNRPADWFDDYDQLLLRCLADALEEGKKMQGDRIEAWDYGRFNQLTFSHPVVGRIPWVGRYFNLGPAPMDGSSTTVRQTTRRLGPSMRFVADLSNWEASLHNITIGQSGQLLSSHFSDQWKAYYSGSSFSMHFREIPQKNILRVEPLQ
ncbi:MAG: penicillin acylase family protein [Bryobacteraceae bacterium]|nr:penicillin acylase family protein [Bryobacteraceae bacterium]MDW8378038.1 penicillin acylase family protein [Bryobacterales bacterium]